MSVLSKTPWLKRLAIVLVTALSIGVLTVPTAPANARVFIGFGFGAPVGWGYYAPPYYGYYGYPYYPTYYGYPGSSSAAPSAPIATGTTIVTGDDLSGLYSEQRSSAAQSR
jgi:hypothetical protein